LSYITLFRAIQFRLANAQQIISHLNSHGIVIPPSGLTPEIFDGLHKVCADLSDAERAEINNNTPLWLYVLREAEVRSDGRLGPVGSRIVAESIHASIEAAENNILTGNEFIVASELSEKETSLFTLDMMIEAVTSGSM